MDSSWATADDVDDSADFCDARDAVSDPLTELATLRECVRSVQREDAPPFKKREEREREGTTCSRST